MTTVLLIVREPGRPAFTHPLRHGLRVGRHVDNDLVLESSRVSRQHAQFSISGGRTFVSDLGSTHGVWVRGERIQTSRQIFLGEEIRFGDVVIVLADAAQAARAGSTGGWRDATVPPTPTKDDMLELARVVELVLTSDEPETALHLVARAACSAVDGRRVTWGRLRADGSTEVHPDESAAPGPALTERLLSEALLLHDPSDGMSSSVGAPLRADQQVFGYLFVSEEGRAERFSSRDRDRVAAYAMLGARLYGHALERRRLRHTLSAMAESPGEPIVGASASAARLRERVVAVARERERGHLLVVGPQGSGRRHVARAVHGLVARSSALVELSCGLLALDREQAPTVLRELVARVCPGTILLDEIGALPRDAQEALVGILDGGEAAELRLLATGRHPSDPLAHAGRLLPALERLFSTTIEIPPLAARCEDVAPLASYFLARSGARWGWRVSFDDEALRWLAERSWTGEVAEVRRLAERVGTIASAHAADRDPRVMTVGVRLLEEAVRGPAVA